MRRSRTAKQRRSVSCCCPRCGQRAYRKPVTELQRLRDRQAERAQYERSQGLAPAGNSRCMRRIGGEVAQLERVRLEIVELVRLVLAYPAYVFVATEAHGTVVDVRNPRERILVAVVLHQESVATACAATERKRQERSTLHRVRNLRLRRLQQRRCDVDRERELVDAPRLDGGTMRNDERRLDGLLVRK